MTEGKKVLEYHQELCHTSILFNDGSLPKIDGQNAGELESSFIEGNDNLKDMKERLHTICTEIDRKGKERNELARLIEEIEKT